MQLAIIIRAIRAVKQRGMEVRCELQSTSKSLHYAQAGGEQRLACANRARFFANESIHCP